MSNSERNRRHPGNRANSVCQGFTLAELLVWLTCIGILLALAVPGVHHIQQEWSLLASAHMLEYSLSWARFHSIVTNSSLALRIEPDGSGFYWEDADGTAYEQSVRSMAPGVRISRAPRRSLRFHPSGRAAPAGTVQLEGSRGSYRVVVNFAGRVRVQKK